MHPTKPKTRKQRQSFWSPTNIALVTVVALWTLVHLSSGNIYVTTTISKEPRYVAVIDAGSSGSQIYIYKYSFTPYGYLKFEPDPATFKSLGRDFSADKAGSSLEPLLEFAKAHVPANLTESTPIIFKISFGFREFDKVMAHSTLQNVRLALGNSEFRFRPSYAEITTDEEELTLGWLALNYLHETKNGLIRYRSSLPQKPVWSVLKVGRSSAHICIPLSDTFGIPDEYIAPYSYSLLGYSHNLFTQPFDGFGIVHAKAAVNSVIQRIPAYRREGKKYCYQNNSNFCYHPCYPSGYREAW